MGVLAAKSDTEPYTWTDNLLMDRRDKRGDDAVRGEVEEA
jgi:hypothetical protein